MVILSCDRQDHSISRRWLRLRQALHAHPRTSGEEASAKPNLINKCSSPVPQLSEMKMILCGSEQSDGDSAGGSGIRQKEGEKGDRVRPEGGTSSKAQFLKGKVSLYWKARR